MIVDVHTHPPSYRDTVPADRQGLNSQWRPDKAVRGAVTWAEYMQAMEVVDKACVFGIAYKGRPTIRARAATSTISRPSSRTRIPRS